MTARSALITGITGQDGSYLAKFLLDKGYEVHGLRRRVSQPHIERLASYGLRDGGASTGIVLHYGDMTDSSSINRIISEVHPDEIYNLAAQSHVRVSFDTAEYTNNVNAIGTMRILDALRNVRLVDKTRLYQASSSEMFGNAGPVPQDEHTPFEPQSPYAVSKLNAHWSTVNFRNGYGLHASCGILFNHESPRRSPTFVTRKITRAVARYKAGLGQTLKLGNLEARRDWGYAPEYVEVMWTMLQQDAPGDYVIGTGETTSVRRFTELAFESVGRKIEWSGEGVDEQGIDSSSGEVLVAIDPYYFRPTEVNYLQSNPVLAASELSWKAATNVRDLVKIMVHADLAELNASVIDESRAP